MGIFCAVAVVGSAIVAHSLPRNMHQAPSNTSGLPAGAATIGNVSAPEVIASGFEARSLAIQPDAATTASSRQAPLFATTADQPNQLFSLNFTGTSAAATAAAASPVGGSATLSPIAGIGAAGSLGDGGLATAAELNLKLDSLIMRSGVAVAADGTIFVADTHNATIRRIAGPASSEPGVISSVAGRWAPRQNIELVEPMGIALDRAGNLYIADHGANSVLILPAATSRAPGALQMLANVALPASIAVTRDGTKVFVAAPENGAVFAIEPQSQSIQSVAGFVGQNSDCPASGPAPAGPTEVCPAGLAVDGGGNVFVTDLIANRVVRVDAQTAAVTIAAGNLSAPGDVSIDPNGNLFVAEQGRERLVVIRGLGVPVSGVTLTPASNDFGVEPLNGVSPTAPFTLTNAANSPLTALIVGAYVGPNRGDFQTASTSCMTTLAANSSCLINVALSPSDVGPLSAQLAVLYAGAGSALTANVTGTGADYQIGLAPNQANIAVVTAGNSATYNLQITPDANFPTTSPYTVTLVCPPIASPAISTTPAGFLPRVTTCTFTPPTATIAPGTAIPVTFVVMTTSPTTGILGFVPPAWRGWRPGGRWGAPLFPALVLILGLGGIGILSATYGRAARKPRVVSIVAVFLTIAAIAAGCGGGGPQILGTPTGTANFLVQATVQNAQGTSLNVTRSVALQLIVQ